MGASEELFSIRDARESDMELVDAYSHAEGMDDIPGTRNLRVAVNGDDVVVGFCRLDHDEQGNAYVNPIVVYGPWRGYGVGRALMRDALARAGQLRLIARGTSEGFYRRLGFRDMPWEEVDFEAANEDCDNCPYRESCGPVPMKADRIV